MQTQAQRLLAYLQEHHAINPLDAWARLGIYRLGARIFDLRRDGHAISSGVQKVPNRFGETCRVASYRLETSAPAAAE